MIDITNKLNFTDYLKVNYYLTYRKPIMIIFILIALSNLILLIKGFIDGTPIDYVPLGFCLAMLAIPVFTYFSLKKNYRNTRINEQISYSIDNKTIYIKGESFDVSLSIDKIYKVSETRSWILIWETKYGAHILLKKKLSADQIAELKSIVESYPNVRNKMK